MAEYELHVWLMCFGFETLQVLGDPVMLEDFRRSASAECGSMVLGL